MNKKRHKSLYLWIRDPIDADKHGAMPPAVRNAIFIYLYKILLNPGQKLKKRSELSIQQLLLFLKMFL